MYCDYAITSVLLLDMQVPAARRRTAKGSQRPAPSFPCFRTQQRRPDLFMASPPAAVLSLKQKRRGTDNFENANHSNNGVKCIFVPLLAFF